VQFSFFIEQEGGAPFFKNISSEKSSKVSEQFTKEGQPVTF